MALTRSMLKTMGLTEEQVDTIIAEHTSTVDGLKKQRDDFEKERDDAQKERDDFKKKADKIPELEKEIQGLKDDHTSASDWKEKYDALHKKHEEYKTEIANKETAAKVRNAYKKLLAECKVGDKHVESILKVTDFSNLKLNETGAFDNADDLKKKIQDDWSGFISSTETRGAGVETPPAGTGEAKSTRAAELAQKYHENLYGKTNKEE